MHHFSLTQMQSGAIFNLLFNEMDSANVKSSNDFIHISLKERSKNG